MTRVKSGKTCVQLAKGNCLSLFQKSSGEEGACWLVTDIHCESAEKWDLSSFTQPKDADTHSEQDILRQKFEDQFIKTGSSSFISTLIVVH